MPKIKAIHELQFTHPKTGKQTVAKPGSEHVVSAEDAEFFVTVGAAELVAGAAEEETKSDAAVVTSEEQKAEEPKAPKKTGKKDTDKELI